MKKVEAIIRHFKLDEVKQKITKYDAELKMSRAESAN